MTDIIDLSLHTSNVQKPTISSTSGSSSGSSSSSPYLAKPWLPRFEEGVPHEINPFEFETLNEMFLKSFDKFPKHNAVGNFDKYLTFAEMRLYSQHFANFLTTGGLNLPNQSRVALMMPNIIPYAVTVVGTLLGGMICVNINPMYTARELTLQLKDAEVSVLVVLENFASTVGKITREAVPSLRSVVVVRIGDLLGVKGFIMSAAVKYVKRMVPAYNLYFPSISFKDALKKGSISKFVPPLVTGEDIAFLQYTGGTTGISKGAILTHHNMVANIMQSSAWVLPSATIGGDFVVVCLPVYHIFSLTANLLVFIMLGGCSYFITNPRDMPAFVKDLRGKKPTVIMGVNALYNGLMNTPGFESLDFSKMILSLGGGMAMHTSIADKWQRVTGVPIAEAYGLTEASPAVCINPLNLPKYSGNIGLPIPSTIVAIWDEQGNEVGVGEIGELVVRGPQVMRGYWRNEEETMKCLSGGWLYTGDLGYMDNAGSFFIVDRRKDIIIVSGFNVYPNEIEETIQHHPKVEECAVIGIPTAVAGECVKAFIVCSDTSLTEKEVFAYCRENLTGYKRPRTIEFVKSLPKSAVGKIVRRELRDMEKISTTEGGMTENEGD